MATNKKLKTCKVVGVAKNERSTNREIFVVWLCLIDMFPMITV